MINFVSTCIYPVNVNRINLFRSKEIYKFLYKQKTLGGGGSVKVE